MSEKERESLRLPKEYDDLKRKKLTKEQRQDIYIINSVVDVHIVERK